jgi:hypothetical protein
LHDPVQRNLFDLNKKVKMILHQCVGIKVEGVSVLVVREIGKERLQVFFVKKDPLPSIPVSGIAEGTKSGIGGSFIN